MGLQGMINDMLERCDHDPSRHAPRDLGAVKKGDRRSLARLLTALENGVADPPLRARVLKEAGVAAVPTLGITGTGGSGKSSLADELVRRFRLDQQDRIDIAVLAVDPSRRKSGGALLGDRIRMNAIGGGRVFMRSLATRGAHAEVAKNPPDLIAACKVAGFGLVLVETSGIGQGDSGIVPLVDASLYVMTPEYGAASQLEKIDMLDFADFVAINKFDRKGAEDALRDVRKQVQRNRKAFDRSPEEMPVYGTIASRFNDDGVTALYQGILPPARSRYLAEIADALRGYHAKAAEQSRLARERQQLGAARDMLAAAGGDATSLVPLIEEKDRGLAAESKDLIESWPETKRT